jgi:GDP-L-fucose synthase
VTIRHTVNSIKEISGFSGEVEWDASKPDGQKLREYDISRLKAIGFKTQMSFEKSLEETYSWYEANAASARR